MPDVHFKRWKVEGGSQAQVARWKISSRRGTAEECHQYGGEAAKGETDN